MAEHANEYVTPNKGYSQEDLEEICGKLGDGPEPTGAV